MKGRGAFPMLRLKRLSKEIKPSNGHRGLPKKCQISTTQGRALLGGPGPRWNSHEICESFECKR